MRRARASLIAPALLALACGSPDRPIATARQTSTASPEAATPGPSAPAHATATTDRSSPAASEAPRGPRTAPPTARRPLPDAWHRGVNVTAYSDGGFTARAMDDTLARIRADGGNLASIVLVCYMPTKSSVTITCDDRDLTPSDASVAGTIARAHALGLKVALNPHVDPADETFRAEITPESWRQWFDAYKAVLHRYAVLAQANGVEMLVVGTELDSSHACDICGAGWNEVIDDVKSVYRGALTYAAQFETGFGFPAWQRMDVVGVDAYYPLAATADNPGVEALARAWHDYTDEDGATHHWFADLEALSRRTGKPVMFTEVGYANATGTANEPWDERPSSHRDPSAQADAYEALFRTFAGASWFAGVWMWEFQADREPDQTIGHDPRGMPAEDVLRRWFG